MTSYTQSGSGASLSDAQIAAGTFDPGTFFVQSGGDGTQLSQQQIAARVIPPTPAAPTAPAQTPIPNPVPAPTGGGAPVPPNANAPTALDQFHTGLDATVQAQQQQLQDSYKQQQANYQQQIDALNQKNSDYQDLVDSGLATQNDLVLNESHDKAAALQTEQDQFQKNYDARQKLTDQLQGLLQQGQDVITGLKNTSGLSSIMNARISETMANVTGQAGVISTALAAYSSQIGLAQSQLTSATNSINQIYGDQIDYWKNVVNFYSGQQKDNNVTIATLSKDQKAYIDAQISSLEDKVKATQATSDMVQKAMLNPDTALAYAKAGVSLTDSPAQINQKLATQAYAEELSKLSQDMAAKGYSTTPVAGAKPVVVQDSQGNSHTYYGTTKATTTTPPPTTGSYPKGTMASKQYVELSLQRAGLSYDQATAKVPAGYVGVIDNASGQVGYIKPTEYTTKQYTYL